jgi:hypothetical protein
MSINLYLRRQFSMKNAKRQHNLEKVFQNSKPFFVLRKIDANHLLNIANN